MLSFFTNNTGLLFLPDIGPRTSASAGFVPEARYAFSNPLKYLSQEIY